MRNGFVALDVETADFDRASICQIGLVKVVDGHIADTFESLVHQPSVEPYFTDIHGIKESDLKDAPSLDYVLRKAVRFIGDIEILACHTLFDRQCLKAARADLPWAKWIDTAKVARRAWPGHKRNGIEAVCKRLGCYDEDEHHNALADARMAANILLAAVRDSGESVNYWLKRQTLPITKRPHAKGRSFSDIAKEPNGDGEHFGSTVCFTGKLSMVRSEAVAMAAEAGFLATATVNGSTDYLVIGVQNPAVLNGNKSNKQKAAEALAREGKRVTILVEDEFVALCGETA